MEIEFWEGSKDTLPPNADMIYKAGLLGYFMRSAYLGMSVSPTRCPLLCSPVCVCTFLSACLSERPSVCLPSYMLVFTPVVLLALMHAHASFMHDSI